MDEWGFPERHDVAGRFSIADLIPRTKKRCGVYLLEYADGFLYVGQATDVVRRFAQHRQQDDHIVAISFRPVRRAELDTVERDLIRRVEAAGLPLTNRIHVSQIHGGCDLDDLVSPSDQQSWLATGQWQPTDRRRVRIVLEADYRVRGANAYRRFSRLPHAESVIENLRRYVSLCILAPTTTEFSFWIVSCLPSTNQHTWPRYAAVSMNGMETFVVGHLKEDLTQIWALWNLSRSSLLEDQSRAGFLARHPGVQIHDGVDYQAGGFDQITLHVDGLNALEALLDDDVVQHSARLLNLRLMQKGATVYSRFHHFELADQLLESLSTPAISDPPAGLPTFSEGPVDEHRK